MDVFTRWLGERLQTRDVAATRAGIDVIVTCSDLLARQMVLGGAGGSVFLGLQERDHQGLTAMRWTAAECTASMVTLVANPMAPAAQPPLPPLPSRPALFFDIPLLSMTAKALFAAPDLPDRLCLRKISLTPDGKVATVAKTALAAMQLYRKATIARNM